MCFIRELVKLFSFESSHRKELVHFLSGLMTSLPDNAALKRFLQKECPGELPSEEEAWEVPQPVLPVQPIPGNVSCTDQCDYTHRNIMTEDMEVNCRHSLLELLSSNSSGITGCLNPRR